MPMTLEKMLEIPKELSEMYLRRCPEVYVNSVTKMNSALRCCLPSHHPGPHVYARRDDTIVQN